MDNDISKNIPIALNITLCGLFKILILSSWSVYGNPDNTMTTVVLRFVHKTGNQEVRAEKYKRVPESKVRQNFRRTTQWKENKSPFINGSEENAVTCSATRQDLSAHDPENMYLINVNVRLCHTVQLVEMRRSMSWAG